MCLSTIEKVYDPPNMELRRGWKACERIGRRIGARYYSVGRGLPVGSASLIKCGRWYKAVVRPQLSDLNQDYNTGFHIFVTDSDAYFWGRHTTNCMKTVVVPVWYVSTRIAGTQDRATCHVADWIYYCSGPDHGPSDQN
jgi:hypothetical protein